MTELTKEGDTMVTGLSFRVLGPVQVLDGDTVINVGGPAPRLALVQLLFNPNRVVSTDALVDALWGDDPPATARRSLQSHVARLRAALGGEDGPLRPQAPGYVLTVDESQIDLFRSEQLVRRARGLLESDPREAQRLARQAQHEWTGEPLGDLAQHDQLVAQRRRLDQLWLDLTELSVDAQLAAGENTSAVEQLESLVLDRPEHEPFWARLMTAYYRLGRQSDALTAFQRARTALLDGFGIDPSPTLQRLEMAILGQSAELDSTETEVCPYKGLASYQLDDADNFYGRDDLVAELLEAVRTASFVVVVGSSGAGKSSALRAGLVKAVGTNRLSVCRQACVITPGTAPLRAIYQAPSSADLIIVDQFEELFTLTDDDATRSEFVRLLLARINDHSDQVVISLRADFYGYCTRIAELAPLLARRQVVVGPLSEHELRVVIAKPAEAAGLVVDEELIDTIVEEAADHAGALPLVSHALVETWHRRADGHLTLAAYREAGSIAAAIARTAERAYNGFQPEQRAQAERLFLRLVEPGEGTESSRRKVSYAQLEGSSIDRRVIDLLVDARLLTAEADGIEIAHEALVGAWPRLAEWIDDGRDGMRLHRHLTSAASAWEEVGRDEEELYRGARLSGALTWIGDAAPDLSNLERDFLDASVALSERRIRQQARANRRLRVLVALSLVGVIIATIGIVLAVSKARDAERRKAQAEAARIVTTVRSAPDLSNSAVLELAIEADRRASTSETKGLLLDAIARNPAVTVLDDLDLSPSGRTPTSSNGNILTGTDNNVLGAVYDTETLKPLKQGLQPAPLVVVNTGSRLLGVTGPSLKVVDLNSRVTIGRFPDVTARATQIGLSPDGTLLAVATTADENGDRAGVTVYDVATETQLMTLTSPAKEVVTDVAFGPDRRHVVGVVGESDVAVWDTTSGERVFESPLLSSSAVTRTAMSPSGDLIAFGRDEGQLEIWSVNSAGTWLAREIHSTHRAAIAWIDFDSDGGRMVTTSRDGVAIVWDTTTGSPISRPRTFPTQRGLASFFRPGSSSRLVTIADGNANEWDAQRDGEWFTTVAGSNSDAVTFGSTDPSVLTTTGTEVTVYNTAGEGHEVRFELPAAVIRGLATSADGTRFVVVYPDGSVELRDTASGGLVTAVGRDDFLQRVNIGPKINVAIDRAGHRIAYETVDHRIHIIDDTGTSNESSIALSPSHQDLQSLDLNDDGDQLVVSTTSGEAIWYDLDGIAAGSIAESGAGYDAHFTSDDLVSVTGRGLAQIIDPRHRQTTRSYDLGINAKRLAVDPAGRLLATADDDGLVQLWSADSAAPIGAPLEIRLTTGPDRIRFSADGHYLLVSGTAETTWINVWTPDWQRVACSLVTETLPDSERARYLGSLETTAPCS